MNPTEKFVRQATRGLWGQKRRDAKTELRGAVEDKVYRHRLLGLKEAEATAAALRDLGSPSAIARELGEVHTMPQMLKTLLFVGVGAMLGLQAVAQVTVVKSAYYLPTDVQMQCRLQTTAELALISVALRDSYDRIITAQGGPDKYLKQCRRGSFSGFVLLKVNDLLAALKAGGVHIAGQADATPTTPLFVFTGPDGKLPAASFTTIDVQGQRYVPSSMLITFLKGATPLPLRLTGLTNPVLQVGGAKLRLGTVQAPVQAADLLAAALIDERRGDTSFPLPVALVTASASLPRDPAAPKLALSGQDGTFYAILQNLVNVGGGDLTVLTVDALRDGTVNFITEPDAQPEIVTSLEALDAATASRQRAVLVYKLDASDLRDMKLAPLSAAQVNIKSP